MALHRIQDSLVVNLSALRTAIDIECSHALLTQHSYDRIDQGENEGIRRRFRQGKVKVQIRLDVGVGVVPRIVHYTDGFSHRYEVLIVRANCRQSGNFGFQNFANLHQVSRPVWLAALENAVQRLPHGIRIAIGDERPAPRKGVYKSLFVQCLDRLANRGPADTKLLREFAFRRELIARLQSTLEDGFFDLLDDLFVKARSLDYLIHEVFSTEPVFPPRTAWRRFHRARVRAA